MALSTTKALRERELNIIKEAIQSITTLERFHGKPTQVAGAVLLGYHHKINEQDLSDEQGVAILAHDLDRITNRLRQHTAKLTHLCEARIAVILHLGLVLGADRLEGMKAFWAALRANDFEKAGEEALLSEWPSLVGTDEASRRRVIVLDRVLRIGEWPADIQMKRRR